MLIKTGVVNRILLFLKAKPAMWVNAPEEERMNFYKNMPISRLMTLPDLKDEILLFLLHLLVHV